MATETKKRRGVPKSTGRFFDVEDELYEKINETALSLNVSKTQVINEAIRQGLTKAIDKIKYG
jgi:predicted transcriptional regulator